MAIEELGGNGEDEGVLDKWPGRHHGIPGVSEVIVCGEGFVKPVRMPGVFRSAVSSLCIRNATILVSYFRIAFANDIRMN